ncbi:isopenicillin N synthase family dioxygenase [Lacibacterium aquatile]|uniref:2-oxoglutarate-dependent ethylene/succinate-forming enzyme n=1 Tax=Lacibacterium aquatile TaxID=1168082 RepID=A0ABW5DRY0_9PROT
MSKTRGKVMETLPVIDITPLFSETDSTCAPVARAIETACRDTGFFYIAGHGIAPDLLKDLDRVSRAFFALPHEQKMRIDMTRGGPAWRGFFPVGGELTSGRPDIKEGLYLGTELAADHPRVKAGVPLHGANLWPEAPSDLRQIVSDYMAATTRAGHALMRGIALSLGLDGSYFAANYTADPTVLFRIFHYPASKPQGPEWQEAWGVGEHTDYGLLTLLAQDDNGGLQVKSKAGWIEAPPIPGTLVCNIGDMLDRMTGGWYRSTPHRVMNVSGKDRLSFPLFFDPDFDARILPLPTSRIDATLIDQDRRERWDKASVHSFSGTYGDYLLGKVSKVFPDLSKEVL